MWFTITLLTYLINTMKMPYIPVILYGSIIPLYTLYTYLINTMKMPYIITGI